MRRQGASKTFPKPSQNPPQTSPKSIKKTHAKNTWFLEPFFSRFSWILASKTTHFALNFWCMLASKFHRFLEPFRLPNPLVLGTCSITLNIEREKWDFLKCAFYLGKITIFQVACIEEISRFKQQLMKQRVENPLKIPLFLAIDFIKNVPKFDQK